jgi:hypothetical protein
LNWAKQKTNEKEMNQNMKTEKNKNMKRYLLIIALLLGAVSSRGQVVSDQAAVLQKIIDLPGLQQYYPKNSDGSLKQLCISQFPTEFAAGVMAGFDASKVVFRTREAITANQAEAYFMFRSFNLDQSTCTAVVNYFYNFNYASGQFNIVTCNIELQQSGTVWNVTNLNLGGTR